MMNNTGRMCCRLVKKESYRVEIRSLEDLQNSCTCPDYKNNLIGTCKHIYAIQLRICTER